MQILTGTLYDRMGGARSVEKLVHAFYDQAARDPVLSPVFTAAAAGDPGAWWARHLTKMVRFWTSVSGGPPYYHGSPVLAHDGFGIEARHFDAWLTLWHDVLFDSLEEDVARELLVRATRMRHVLERHLSGDVGNSMNAYGTRPEREPQGGKR
ncbi:truncated hemoglobin [Deinococcus yavapaiensis]|uniref:Hemoglobin n=1 Tax=Deinococcus yavapaiensis KR-236 TaxID=694435 RepID=A0A318SFN1_9DEIO|nr:group III truncated hemoglobin [Deinococcus yavapaiensis]PYE56587.1 hemoglobin [Deinococcus yavapaiensis KR-236]